MILLITMLSSTVQSFVLPPPPYPNGVQATTAAATRGSGRALADHEQEEETYVVGVAGRTFDDDENDFRDELTAPPVRLAQESVLFGENPATRRNNAMSALWTASKVRLPPVFTGAWPWRPQDVADDNPIGGLYNMAFVRLPVLAVAVAYLRNNVSQDIPLVMDVGLGGGPFVVHPLFVLTVLALILA